MHLLPRTRERRGTALQVGNDTRFVAQTCAVGRSAALEQTVKRGQDSGPGRHQVLRWPARLSETYVLRAIVGPQIVGGCVPAVTTADPQTARDRATGRQ